MGWDESTSGRMGWGGVRWGGMEYRGAGCDQWESHRADKCLAAQAHSCRTQTVPHTPPAALLRAHTGCHVIGTAAASVKHCRVEDGACHVTVLHNSRGKLELEVNGGGKCWRHAILAHLTSSFVSDGSFSPCVGSGCYYHWNQCDWNASTLAKQIISLLVSSCLLGF